MPHLPESLHQGGFPADRHGLEPAILECVEALGLRRRRPRFEQGSQQSFALRMNPVQQWLELGTTLRHESPVIRSEPRRESLGLAGEFPEIRQLAAHEARGHEG
jgi:hypothetical protein